LRPGPARAPRPPALRARWAPRAPLPPPPPAGPLQTLATIVREEGAAAPFKGLTPGVHRQFVFTGLRLGLYDRVKGALAGDADPSEMPVSTKVAAAVLTSSVGITAANPADVVKVRFQADTRRAAAPAERPAGGGGGGPAAATPPAGPAGRPGPAPGTTFPAHGPAPTMAVRPPGAGGKPGGPGGAARFLSTGAAARAPPQPPASRPGALATYLHIARAEGLAGLYRGYSANLLRNSLISCGEIVTYDVAKSAAVARGYEGERCGGPGGRGPPGGGGGRGAGATRGATSPLPLPLPRADGVALHLGSGLLAGLVATLLGSPADVIGTRVIAQEGRGGGLASVAAEMVRREGFLSLYQGFWPNFARIGSFNIVMWMGYEHLRGLLGA